MRQSPRQKMASNNIVVGHLPAIGHLVTKLLLKSSRRLMINESQLILKTSKHASITSLATGDRLTLLVTSVGPLVTPRDAQQITRQIKPRGMQLII